MKNLKLVFSLVLAAGCVSMIGCSKSSTSTPAAAPTDSVLYTNWTPLAMQGFIVNTGDTFYSQTIIAKSITSAVVDRGIVLGYLMSTDQTSGDTLIENVSTFMTMVIYPDSIYLESDPFQPSPSAGIDFSGVNFRYVVIPGKIATTRAGGAIQSYTAAELKAMPYATVKKLFNLPELFTLPKGYSVGPRSFIRKE